MNSFFQWIMGLVNPKLIQRATKQACTFVQSGKINAVVSRRPTCDTESASLLTAEAAGLDWYSPSFTWLNSGCAHLHIHADARAHVHPPTRCACMHACVVRINAFNNVYSGLVKVWKSWEAFFWYCLWRLHPSEVFLFFFSLFFTHFSWCAKSNGWKI